jgi:ABC-type branched-subunit amino acid transport system substrate-binding protein
MSRVYVSLPLSGPSGPLGRDVLRGAELALERQEADVELVVLDAAGEDRDAQAAANARAAVADAKTLAYLGDFHSSQVLASAPVLSAAGMLQVAPVATFTGLSGSTLVRLSPDDQAGARAIADWLAENGVTRLLVVHDHDDGYGIPVGRMCTAAARARGVEVRSRPVWDRDEPMAGDVAVRRRCSTPASRGRAPWGCGASCTPSTRACGCSGPRASRHRGSPTS